MSEKVLGEKIFSLKDQSDFAKISGDINPIHLDSIDSRKSISGECIVHGINSFLWALEFLLKNNKSIHTSYSINFKNKIPLNQKILFLLDENNKQILIKNRFNKILVLINYKGISNYISKRNSTYLNNNKILDSPFILDESEINIGRSIQSIYGGEIDYLINIYPLLFRTLGKHILYEISILSNIIGMQMPGRHSLFTYCELNFKNHINLVPSYRVDSFKKNLKLLKLKYIGNNFDSKMHAFIIPHIVPSTIDEKFKKRFLDNKSHRGRKSLVIGGSRGIGSFVSKVISLFGAEVTISYLACEQDALEVRDDINKNTIESMAQIVKFDVLKDNYDDVFKSSYDDLYYFATPKIFDNYSNSFSNEIYKNFRNFYANCFEDIALKFIKSGGKKIYYPSSVAVLNKVRGMEEYTKAKKDGEYVCEELKKRLPVKILVDRIDRVNTSQTLSIMPIGSLEPYEVAISIAKKME